jgi:hypothetical protein
MPQQAERNLMDRWAAVEDLDKQVAAAAVA